MDLLTKKVNHVVSSNSKEECDAVVRKAQYITRLIAQKIDSRSLGKGRAFLMEIAIEFACRILNTPFDKSKLSPNKDYQDEFIRYKNILDLQWDDSTMDKLSVHYPSLKHSALMILEKYKVNYIDKLHKEVQNNVKLHSAVNCAAAFYIAGTDIKSHLDKEKLVKLVEVDKTLFNKVVKDMKLHCNTDVSVQPKGEPVSANSADIMPKNGTSSVFNSHLPPKMANKPLVVTKMTPSPAPARVSNSSNCKLADSVETSTPISNVILQQDENLNNLEKLLVGKPSGNIPSNYAAKKLKTSHSADGATSMGRPPLSAIQVNIADSLTNNKQFTALGCTHSSTSELEALQLLKEKDEIKVRDDRLKYERLKKEIYEAKKRKLLSNQSDTSSNSAETRVSN
jgi:hypothetical protein